MSCPAVYASICGNIHTETLKRGGGEVRDKGKRNHDGMRMSSAKRSLPLPDPTFHKLLETNHGLITRDLSQKKHIYILKIRKYAGPNRPSGTMKQTAEKPEQLHRRSASRYQATSCREGPTTYTRPNAKKPLNVNAKPLKKLHVQGRYNP